ncbi:MAG: 4Fe-4S dicluster domain-containing protein [Mogibacterium sp.]|nr:4Fe-4S dicluster domain-containing protein [Mogibacterium sp.]
MIVRVLRKRPTEEKQYWEEFLYDGTPDISVAGMLDDLNYKDDIVNSAGENVPRIAWECSCLQGMCGGCAMVINGRPALACETFVRDLGDVITIKPLSKFPVINDLVTDRTIIHENEQKVNAYIKEHKPARKEEFEHQYDAAKCLKCGLCLEICPNYTDGHRFFGALFANDCYLIATRSGVYDKAITGDYDTHFAAGCSKSLACVDVCPMKIPTLASIAKMNKRIH